MYTGSSKYESPCIPMTAVHSDTKAVLLIILT